MNRGKRSYSAAFSVKMLREGITESVHTVHAVVCDEKGRVLSIGGDPEHSFFVRSALKPFQALAITSTGTMERFGLTDKDLAIICSSHQGSITHARQAFNILWRSNVDPSLLQCPVLSHQRNALQYNCSGKHAGMLAVCQQRNWSLNTYMHRDHPVQTLILTTIAELLGMPPQEFISAHDDCGVPTYMLQLRQIATLYAKLSSGSHLGMERIIRAMTHHPTLVCGDGQFDTEVMRLAEGGLVSKSGAEGIQCIARVGQGLGIAIKVMDGAKRAKHAVAIHLMKQLGWLSPMATETLEENFVSLGQFTRLEVGGDLVVV
ncbi:MAG: asparaginase [Leptolyngbyaceae bacterium]|nr:asparaginase [Leptolyngbyaceae bacterium]